MDKHTKERAWCAQWTAFLYAKSVFQHTNVFSFLYRAIVLDIQL